MNNRIKSHLEKNETKITNKLRKFNFNVPTNTKFKRRKSIVPLVRHFFFLPFNLEILDIVFEILEGRQILRIFFLPIQKRQTAHQPTRKTGADNNETGFEIKRTSEFSDHLSILRSSFFPLSSSPSFFIVDLEKMIHDFFVNKERRDRR